MERKSSGGRGFSFRIHLVEGAPEGLWHVTRSNWTGLGLVCSRAAYKDLRKRPEFASAGIYLLLGEGDDGRTSLYIGEAESLAARIGTHLGESKTDWTRLVAFTTSDGSLNKAWVRYLEARLIQVAHQAGRALIGNSTGPAPSKLLAWEVDDLESYLENVLMMLPLMGVHVFEKADKDEKAALYRLRARDSDARGQNLSEGFLVLEGSIGNATELPNFHGGSAQKTRRCLIEEGVLVVEGTRLRLTRNYLFSSPSAAAGVLGGSAYNGWVMWKDYSGLSARTNAMPSTARQPSPRKRERGERDRSKSTEGWICTLS